MNTEIINLSWSDIESACINVAHKISISEFKPDIIMPVLWGGIIPCRILMDILNWDRSICVPIEARSYCNCEQNKEIHLNIPVNLNIYKNTNILIIEEIIDSGKTIAAITEKIYFLYNLFPHIRVASIITRYNSPSISYCDEIINNQYVIFPWDKQEYMRTII